MSQLVLVTKLWVGGPRNRSSILVLEKGCLLFQYSERTL